MATFSARRKLKVCSAPWTGARRTSLPTRPRSRIRHREKISPYDFKRPERVGKEQMRSLQTMHEALRPQLRRRPFGAAAHDRRAEAHQRRPAHLQRVRVQPGKSDVLQPDQRQAARRPVDSRHQSVAAVPDHRSPVGRRQRSDASRAPAAHRDRAAPRVANHRPVLQGNEARLGKRARLGPFDRSRGEQPTTRADRAAERSRRADQLRAHARRSARHDEPVHSVQFDRTNRHATLVQQLGQLRHEEGDAGKHRAQSATSSTARSWMWSSNWPKRTSPRPT